MTVEVERETASDPEEMAVTSLRTERLWLTTPSGPTTVTEFATPAPSPTEATRGALTGTNVVLISSIGIEGRTTEVGLPHLGRLLAASGARAAAMQLAGFGQSLTPLDDDDIVARWLGQIRETVEWFQASSPGRIVVVAPRLTTVLACVALAGRPVDTIVAWSPTFSGRRWARETQLLADHTYRPDQVARGDPGDLVVGGFDLPANTMAAIRKLDATGLPAQPCRRIIAVESEDRPIDTAAVKRLRAEGIDVEQVVGKDTAAWLYVPLHESRPPTQSIAAVLDRLTDAPPADPSRPHEAGSGRHDDLTTREVRFRHGTTDIVEAFDSLGDIGLAAAISRPADRQPSSKWLLFLSTIGPSGEFVPASRTVAGHGHVAIRFDLSGFGLSPPRSGATANELFTQASIDDVDLAVADAVERGAGEIGIIAFCADVWSALRTRPTAELVSIDAINPQMYVNLGGAGIGWVMRAASKRLQGNRVTRKLARALHRIERRWAPPGRMVKLLTGLTDAGVTVRFYFGADDGGLTWWRRLLEPRLATQLEQGRIVVRTYPAFGHNGENAVARRELFDDVLKSTGATA